MTPAEHYCEAETLLLRAACETTDGTASYTADLTLKRAQVHATLATVTGTTFQEEWDEE